MNRAIRNPEEEIRNGQLKEETQEMSDEQDLFRTSPHQNALGVEAIFSHHSFANRASQLYITPYKSFLDNYQRTQAQHNPQEEDPNVLFSVNTNVLWLLLRDKINKIGSNKIYKNASDRAIIKYSLNYGAMMTLNQAKEKMVSKSREGLRIKIRQQVKQKIKTEFRRRDDMGLQFDKSNFINETVKDRLNLTMKNIIELKQSLLSFNFHSFSHIRSYLQRIISYVQKAVANCDDLMGATQIIKRQAYLVILICNYLNIYLSHPDWLNNLLKNSRVEQLFFSHLSKPKGFHILQRVMDDAPLKLITKQIKLIQEIYHRR